LTAGALRAGRRRGGNRRRGVAAPRRTLAQRLRPLREILSRSGTVLLAVIFLLLQVRLWTGDGGVQELWQLGHEVDAQTRENTALRERNEALEAEVLDLKEGAAAVEERARRELSMIRRDETFFQAVER
jgi:cell division protein FtsB